ncbi:TetR family transcriptional regulator [Paenibacillus sp. USDA918EY]|nr:TetR family transcriptional regulator [Paenibacillus sp. USDA918EY]
MIKVTRNSFCGNEKAVARLSPKLTDRRKEGRSLQILEAAKRVFIEKGYGAATLKDIVEETGMSRGWIYLYFQSKDEIFEALLDLQDMQHERYVEELIKSSSYIWEVMITLLTQQFQELYNPPNAGLMPAFYEYFLIGWRDGQRRALLMKRYEKGVAQFAKLIQMGVDRGEFSPDMSIMDIARLAASYQEGIMTHSITVGTELASTRMQFDSLVEYLKSLLCSKWVHESDQQEEME